MNCKNNASDKKGSKTAILQALRIYGPVSRIELVRLANLSRAAVSTAVAELIECGLVQETDNRQTTGGRPATFLELLPDSHIIIGADFDNKIWTLGAFDLAGNLVDSEKLPVNDSTPEAVIHALISNLQSFVNRLKKKPLMLLGLGMPGFVDSKAGFIHSAADLGWYQVNIGEMVESKIGWPVVAINRHRARGISECRFGSAREYQQVIYAGIGTGIAAGLFQNCLLITGAIGGAGELGHMTMLPDGPVCPCGNRGCLQTLASAAAIEREARMLIRSGESMALLKDRNYDIQLLKAEDICQAAEEGDPLALKVVSDAATYMGIALANLVNLFNPEAIILGGPIPRISSHYVKTAEKVLKQRAMGPLASNVIVRTAYLKDIGGALGAANYALDKHISFSLMVDS